MKTANKIFTAVRLWLQKRLNLQISPEKSKTINLKKQSSEFLGLRFKAKKKKNKYILRSHINVKSEEKIRKQLKEKIKIIQHQPTASNINKYNSTVLGIQNYYKMATCININFRKIAFIINKTLWNRTKNLQTNSGNLSETYRKFYKNNYKPVFIASTALFPIADIQHKPAMCFSQEICNYTDFGRKLIRENRQPLNLEIVRYLMQNPIQNESIEYNDNRISLYSGQNGKCAVSGEKLQTGEMEIHHIKPKQLGGNDRYRNLMFVTSNIHKLIHLTDKTTIDKYRESIISDKKSLDKMNKLRKQVGNPVIQ